MLSSDDNIPDYADVQKNQHGKKIHISPYFSLF